MKRKITAEIDLPDGVLCTFTGKIFNASKSGVSLKRKIDLPRVKLEIKENKVLLTAEKGNKNELKFIKSAIAHIKNMLFGLDKKYVYKLEACNVHFPTTLKVEGDTLLINNFLGEKISRRAKILPGVEIEVKGTKITLSSNDLESAGGTATNIEKATKIRFKDRRIFQDGVFLVEKPGDDAK